MSSKQKNDIVSAKSKNGVKNLSYNHRDQEPDRSRNGVGSKEWRWGKAKQIKGCQAFPRKLGLFSKAWFYRLLSAFWFESQLLQFKAKIANWRPNFQIQPTKPEVMRRKVMANVYWTLTTHEACSKYFMHISSLTPLSNPLSWIPLVSSVYKWGNWGNSQLSFSVGL